MQSSFKQIAQHNNVLAAEDISAVSAACLTLDGGSGDGLVYPFDFPDPDVLVVGNTYFAYATNSVAGNIQIIESTNLTNWTAVGNALPTLPSWAAPDATWAPAVAYIGGAYLLYYAALVAGPGGGEECISVATAAQPQGPFIDSSTAPLECQPALGGSIDPSPFIDTDRNVYLEWKSNGGTGPATIWSEQLNPSGTAFVAGASPTQMLTPDQAWQGGIVEAPDLVTSGGRYFLFYSGNNWNSADYGVGVATCTGPLGPCTDGSPTHPGQHLQGAGPGGRGRVHRHLGVVLDCLPCLDGRCGRLSEQPGPLPPSLGSLRPHAGRRTCRLTPGAPGPAIGRMRVRGPAGARAQAPDPPRPNGRSASGRGRPAIGRVGAGASG